MTITSMIADAQKEYEEKSKHHKEMSTALKEMHNMELSDITADCCWVPTTWLKHMLMGSETAKKTFSAEKFLCCHKRLDPDKVGSLKCIPRVSANFFFKMCKEQIPVIGNEMLCLDCVKQRCFQLRIKATLKTDHEMVTKLLKDFCDVNEGFIIGRSSLRYWKTIAMRHLEANTTNEPDIGEDNLQNNGKNKDCDSSEEDLGFNEDLLCKHGNLTTESKDYRIVPEVVWNVIVKHFPNAKEYRTNGSDKPCQICTDNHYDAVQVAQLKKMLVSEQKNHLNHLFHQKKRPVFEDLFGVTHIRDFSTPSFYGVSSEFVKKWREYLQNPLKNTAVSSVENQLLLCPHSKLISDALPSLDASSTFDENELYIELLWPEEWEYISKNFLVDTTISIEKTIVTLKQNMQNGDHQSESASVCPKDQYLETSKDENSHKYMTATNNLVKEPNSDSCQITAKITVPIERLDPNSLKVTLKYTPEICEECSLGRQLQKEHNLRNYTDKEIYVRKIIPDENPLWNKEAFCVGSKELSTRKSKRSHAARGERKITVSSIMTLKQLKIEIMRILSTPPFDQNLWMNGKRLSDDSATLGELSIIPGSTIFLVADEPDEKSLEMLPVITETKPVTEEGFKGTSLLGT